MSRVSVLMVAVLLIAAAHPPAQAARQNNTKPAGTRPAGTSKSAAPAPPAVTSAQVTLKGASVTISIERVGTIERVSTGEALLVGDGFRTVSRPAETGQRLIEVLIAFSNKGAPFDLAREEVTLRAADSGGSNPNAWERQVVAGLIAEKTSGPIAIQGDTRIGMTFEVPQEWLKDPPAQLTLTFTGSSTRFRALVTSDSDILASAASGDIKALRRLLDAGGSVDAKAPRGETPLMMAAENGHAEIVQLLIERGANVNAVASGHVARVTSGSRGTTATMYLRWTALIAAKLGGHSKIEALLTQAGAN